MKGMIALIDANIILDSLEYRGPFYKAAKQVLDVCFDKKCLGYVAAVNLRGGISNIRCLSAREKPEITINLDFADDVGIVWNYKLVIAQKQTGNHEPVIRREVITKNGVTILSRPNDADTRDEELLTQTHLEQITTNKEFREIVRFLEIIKYMHLVPQLLKFPFADSLVTA